MADDRRIITGTHVVAKEGSLLEDGTTRKWKIDDTVGKSLGGKSIVADVANTQNFAGGDAWYQGDNKSTALSVSGVTIPTGVSTDTDKVQFLYVKNLDTAVDCHVSLTVDSAWDTSGDGDGTWASTNSTGGWETSGAVTCDYTAKAPSYDGRWDEGMYIIVPPGGSVQLRGDGYNGLEMNHVRFRSGDGTAINIEYVLAE
jgi:hypothetical protein